MEPSLHDYDLLDVIERHYAARTYPSNWTVYNTTFHVLLATAVAWDDLPLWKRTMQRCQLSRFDEHVWPAIQKWGFPVVLPEYAHACCGLF